MSPDLAEQVVVITGAAGDLGWGIARECLTAGARVALIDLDADALVPLGRADDERILRLQCDVADPMQMRAAVEACWRAGRASMCWSITPRSSRQATKWAICRPRIGTRRCPSI